MAATGFLAAGVHATQITANQAEKERYDELDDMTRTLGTTFSRADPGLRPLPRSQVRSSVDQGLLRRRQHLHHDGPVGLRRRPGPGGLSRSPGRARGGRRAAESGACCFRTGRTARAALTPGTRPMRRPTPTWVILDPAEYRSQGGATLTPVGDGSLLATGTNPDFDTYTIVVQTDLTEHYCRAGRGPGRSLAEEEWTGPGRKREHAFHESARGGQTIVGNRRSRSR